MAEPAGRVADHVPGRHRGPPGPALRERRDDIDPGLVAIADETPRAGARPSTSRPGSTASRGRSTRARLFERYDLLLTPTIACAAFKVGLDGPAEIAGTPTGIYDWIPFTYPFNMTGHPGASVPCGFTSDKLPIGLQILGRRFEDATVLRASAAFEKIAPWAHLRPRACGSGACGAAASVRTLASAVPGAEPVLGRTIAARRL